MDFQTTSTSQALRRALYLGAQVSLSRCAPQSAMIYDIDFDHDPLWRSWTIGGDRGGRDHSKTPGHILTNCLAMVLWQTVRPLRPPLR